MVKAAVPKTALRVVNGQFRRNSLAERRSHTQTSPLPSPDARAPGEPPTPRHNLIYHGGKSLPALTFTNLYLGGTGAWQASDITNIDAALSAAMSDAGLNNVMAQYFPGQTITSTFKPSQTLTEPTLPTTVTKTDAEDIITTLYEGGQLDGYDLSTTVFCLMLPSGTILSDDLAANGNGAARAGKRPKVGADDASDSQNGLGGYHGSVHLSKNDGTRDTVYYAIGVYSEVKNGVENGIVAFDMPWKNVVATFYHELNEARTDPDVEDVDRAGGVPASIHLLGWVSKQGEECGDFPIFEANPLSQVFQEVDLANGSGTVPVQFMYSNAVDGPEGPIPQPHSMPMNAAVAAQVRAATAAVAPGGGHGADLRGMFVPRGIHIPSGRFGRLFPTLENRPPTGQAEAQNYGDPGQKMDAGVTTSAQLSHTIPAGFTFFAQFLDHDLDFDPTSSLERQVDPEAIFNFRTPAFDLDTIYGAGPTASPYLYDVGSRGTLLLTSPTGQDLARNNQGTALVGDPRNDENLLLSQLDLAFIRFHNAVVQGLSGQNATTFTDVFGQPLTSLTTSPNPNAYYENLFQKAQQVVRWHYQWIILHQFLPLICPQTILDDITNNGRQFYRPEDTGAEPFMPVEFSVAAYRYGHATIRSRYQVNDAVALNLFPQDPTAAPTPRTDLRGGPVDPQFVVKWANFFPRDPAKPPQFAKRIEPRLNMFLLDLPVGVVPSGIPPFQRSLATRNLLRSEALELPSGQDVARKLGETVLTDQELGLTQSEPIYLWFYILREAELRTDGQQLGPVGARIVAEVFNGILDLDPTTYRSAFPKWQPTLPSATPGDFAISDLLNIAGV